MTVLLTHVILFYLFVPCLTDPAGNEFIFAKQLHQDICASSNDSVGGPDHNNNSCCGFCTNDQECHLHGSCCLGMHANFTEGKRSIESTRYECIMPQYQTSKEDTLYVTAPNVHPVWMISKCDPLFRVSLKHDTIKELCENPGSVESIESILPVVNNTHLFRNKYCAFCNDVDVSTLESFQMDIQCADMIPITYKDILSTIREKKCNMFYREYLLEFHPALKCSIPGYKISRCNETGLWPVYNATIKQACDAFIDPFNSSYQNYFCYLCNSGEIIPRHNWFCPVPFDMIQDPSPGFSVIVDINALTDMGTGSLGCDLAIQFLDYKMKLCRNVSCPEGRSLHEKTCNLKPDFEQLHTCMTTFLKFTPVQGTAVPGHRLKNREYIEEIWNKLSYAASLSSLKMEVFAKSEWYTGSSFIDYFVVKLLFFTEDKLLSLKGEDQVDMLSGLFSNIHQKVLKLSMTEDTFYCEMAIYEYVSEESNLIKIYDPLKISSSFDTLIFFQGKTNHGQMFCQDSYIPPVKKLHVCAFITLNVNELSIGRTLGIPSLASVALNNTYSTFDYQIQGEKISLCVKDFIILYDILPGPTYDNDIENSCRSWKITYFLNISVYLVLFTNYN